MKIFPVAVTVGLMMMVGVNTAQAHPRHQVHRHHKHVVVERDVVVRPAPVRNAVSRVVGAVFDTIPSHHVRVVHQGRIYYVADGIYYSRQARGYVVVKPVTGVRVAKLPNGYVTVRVGNETLYRFNDITYRRTNGYFIVV